MLWIAGISGMGTQAAARLVRDLVLKPAHTLSTVQSGAIKKPSIAVVAPHWQMGWHAEDYQGTWRVNEYRVVWLGSQEAGAG
jgi:hypothetical protein